MGIRQFNITYLIPEDRLLFSFNTNDGQEFRFWLTRRITLFILAATQHLKLKSLEQTHSPENAKAISDFNEEAGHIRNSNSGGHDLKGVESADQYLPGSQFPLGVEPSLLSEVKCTLEKHGQEDVLSLDLVLLDGMNLNLKIADPALLSMRLLMNRLREYAAWGDLPKVFEIGKTVSEISEGESDVQSDTTKALLH